jgi:citrate lyase subunit beta/citryl-CoA lyase
MINSALMVAGDKIKHLNNIKNLKSDISIINLEDGVFNKDQARDLVCEHLKNNTYTNTQIVVRINSLNKCGIEDIKALNKIKPYAIRVPKISTLNDLQKACDLIHKDIKIHLSIETKEALNNLSKFNIDKRITTVYLGILDMLESLQLPQNLLQLSNPSIDYILSKFLIDSKIANLYPISFVYQDYKNLDQFEQWCKKEKDMGFSAKSCISPSQVEIVNKIFKIDHAEIEKAKYIKSIFEKQKQNGCTGFSDEKYGFIDEPIYKNALLILKNYCI